MGEKLLLSALGELPAVEDGFHPPHGVAPGLIIVGEFCHIFRDKLRVLVGSSADVDGFGTGVLVQLAVVGQLLEPFRVLDKVQIAKFFPFGVLIYCLLIVGLLSPGAVLGKNLFPVQQSVNHHHDDGDDRDDGKDAV